MTIRTAIVAVLVLFAQAHAQSDFYVRFNDNIEPPVEAWQPPEMATMREDGRLDYRWFHVPNPYWPRHPRPTPSQESQVGAHTPEGAWLTAIGAAEAYEVWPNTVTPSRINPKPIDGWVIDDPNDPLLDQQWALTDIHTRTLWRQMEQSFQYRRVRVSMLDSGVWGTSAGTLRHEDVVVVDGWAFDGLDWWDDICRHGTGTASEAAAVTNNGLGIASPAYSAVDLYSMRCLSGCGGTMADVTDGLIVGAIYFDCEITSVSLQGPEFKPWNLAVDLLQGLDKYVVVAASNWGTPRVSPLAMHPWIIAVGAHDVRRERPLWAAYGEGLDISGPGVDVMLALPSGHIPPYGSGYARYQGTSMSTPYVAATLATMLSVLPPPCDTCQYTAADIRQALLDGADPTVNPWEYGAGYLNAARAFIAVVPCLADTNRDGQFNTLDWLYFQDQFAQGDPFADFNADGVLDVFDFVLFGEAYSHAAALGCGR